MRATIEARGAIAQLEERLDRTQEVGGSSPPSSIRRQGRDHPAILLLAPYVLTLLVSSSLIFLIQPMVAKMVLPLLGGVPAVWTTSILFFQAALLAGYAYAHFAVNRLGSRLEVKVRVSPSAGLRRFARPLSLSK